MNKKVKKLYATAALTISLGASVLSGCAKKKNTITPTETPSVTIEVPTVTIEAPTNTPTPTSTPAPTATPTPSPTPAPSERYISYEDLIRREVIYNNYFGIEGTVDEEFQKRVNYIKSFNILTDDEIETLLIYINMNYLLDAEDSEMTNNYLTKCNSKKLDSLTKIVQKIAKYNITNPNKQLALNLCAIGNALNEKERVIISGLQNYGYLVGSGTDIIYAAKINVIRYKTAYDFPILEKDNSKTAEIISMDDLSVIGKYFILQEMYSYCVENDVNRTIHELVMTGTMNSEDLKPLINNKDKVKSKVNWGGLSY